MINYTYPGMRQVDEAIREALNLSLTGDRLREMLDYLISGPGKKVRPLLVLLSAALFNDPSRGAGEFMLPAAAVNAAAAAELIHTASLIHDDIVDRASLRRGRQALHQRWGGQAAVLAGDFLLAKAFKLLADLEQSSRLLPLMARSVSLMCRGESCQLARLYDYSISEEEYLRFNYLKTSNFLAACCEAGGLLSGREDCHELRALRRYGCQLGQAFQIVDDILDFTPSPEKLGKPVGADLRQGVVTLPLIFFLRGRRRFREIFEGIRNRQELPAAFAEQLAEAVRGSGALEQAYRRALKSKQAALEALKQFPASGSRRMMWQMAEAVTARASLVAGLTTPRGSG